MPPSAEDQGVAEALRAVEAAATPELDRAFAAYYPELKKIAHARLRGSGLEGSLQTTGLVHDSYLKLDSGPCRAVMRRREFFAYPSRVLPRIVVDLVRGQGALRRGGDRDIITLDTA